MSSSHASFVGRKRTIWMTLCLIGAAAAGVGLVLLTGKKTPLPSPATMPIAATVPATMTAPTTMASTAPAWDPVRNYGQFLSTEFSNYPQTEPSPDSCELSDAAHLLIPDEVYVDSRGEPWFTHPHADPLKKALTRAGDENVHVSDQEVKFIAWTQDRRATWHAAAVSDGAWVTDADKTRLPKRAYRWDQASTWYDDGSWRIIVPADRGIDVLTTGTELTEQYTDLGATKDPAIFLFDGRGVLAWSAGGKCARFVDGNWEMLDARNWPPSIVQLVPMLDGSVLQLRQGNDEEEDNTIELSIVDLDKTPLDEDQIGDQIMKLGDEDPQVRTAAYETLAQYGPAVYPLLEKHLNDGNPEEEARLKSLLVGKVTTLLGGMQINDNLMSLVMRLPDGGAIFLAPHGVRQPGEEAPPEAPADYLIIEPGQGIRKVPPPIVELLSDPAHPPIMRVAGEWVTTDPDRGPRRFLPPQQWIPLLRTSEHGYGRLTAIDHRNRWYFQGSNGEKGTLILDPTVPDPIPRVAIWVIDSGSQSGWNSADWPVFVTGSGTWQVTDKGWSVMDHPEDLKTSLPAPAPTAGPATRPTSRSTLMPGTVQVNVNSISVVDAKRHRHDLALPDNCVGSADWPGWLVPDSTGRYYLFNGPGRVCRLRMTADSLALEGIMTHNVPSFDGIRRVWLDPAGRIDIAYGDSLLAIIFPTGQAPPELLDIAQPLLRTDEP